MHLNLKAFEGILGIYPLVSRKGILSLPQSYTSPSKHVENASILIGWSVSGWKGICSQNLIN